MVDEVDPPALPKSQAVITGIPETYCKDCPAWSSATRECRCQTPTTFESFNTNERVGSTTCVWPRCNAMDWCSFGRVLTATGLWPGTPPKPADAPGDGQMYVRQSGEWVLMPAIMPEAPIDGKTYGRRDAAWARSVGDPVMVSAGAVSGTAITTAQTVFAVNPPNPNLGGYWNQTAQQFAPPPGAYQVNATLSCVSTNNSADATLLLMINALEFARVTGGAASGNVISCTLGLAVSTNPGDVITFRMMADRSDMVIRTPGSGLSIIGRAPLAGA